jgi:hypothetical protein
MFDKASMKLGLDKALLQRMDTKSSNLPSKSGISSLSKQEVEDLLKKGAYGAFMDDAAADAFCEEDIDQILERRTMVIRHDGDSEQRKGSMFSKASFQASNSSVNVDVNDPDFWDKVKEQAQLDVIEETLEDNLIIAAPRERKKVSKYDGFDGSGDVDNDPSEDYRRPFKPSEVKIWTTTERTRLERLIMQHGFHRFDVMVKTFPRRTAAHIQVCCRALLLRCIETNVSAEKEVLADVKRAIAVFYPLEPFSGTEINSEELAKLIECDDPQILEVPDNELPWPHALDIEVRFY